MREPIAYGTKAVITGNHGHYFDMGAEVVIHGLRTISDNGSSYYWAVDNEGTIQSLKEDDFEVIGQADATTKTKEDDTLTKSFAVGQVVRITGNEVAPLASLITGEEVFIHSLPTGAVTKVVELADDGDEYVRVSTDGIAPIHRHAKPGPQWIKFEHVEDAKGVDLSKDGEDEVEIVAGEIKPGDEVTIIGNEPCTFSKILQGMDRGVHGVEIGRTLTVLSVDERRVIVDTRFEVLADEYYNEEAQAIPLEFVMLASAKREEKLA